MAVVDYVSIQVIRSPTINQFISGMNELTRSPTRCSVINGADPLHFVSLLCSKIVVAHSKKCCIMHSMLSNYSSSKMQNTKKLTKSQIMRDQIALVKQADCATVAQQQAYVVEWMCNMLAFKKQLAKVYVKENWHKV